MYYSGRMLASPLHSGGLTKKSPPYKRPHSPPQRVGVH